MNAARDLLAGDALSVLVVDDDENTLNLLDRLVSRLGHEAVIARSGAQALQRFAEREPDLVLMDIRMPGRDGFATTSAIRRIQGDRWVPVVYMTAYDVDGGLVRAIESGGDDYLAKPISADLLRAKLRAAARAAVLQRENARQRAALERYYQAAEEEQKVASHLMQRLVQTDMLDDPAIQHRITPASHLSGDVIAAARTPGGVLHVLLADGTGHGLAASLGVMPVVQPFYAMTGKGFALGTIAREVNRKVREWLPVGRFVAATLLSVDTRERVLCVWNGGTPPVLLLGRDGSEVRRFGSRNLPLGILDDAALDDSVERCPLPAGAQLLACSDGVIEAQAPDGEAFGIERLASVAAAATPERRMEALNLAVNEHLAGQGAHDDLSLVVVDCSLDSGTARDATPRPPRLHVGGPPAWVFRLDLSGHDLRSTDVIASVNATMERMGLADVHRARLFVILSELFVNALDHGLLLLDPRMRLEPDGAQRYVNLRAKRLRSLSEGTILIELDVDVKGRRRARVRIRDSGEGFDWRGAMARVDDHRGLGRVRQLAASLSFNDPGNDVVASYPL